MREYRQAHIQCTDIVHSREHLTNDPEVARIEEAPNQARIEGQGPDDRLARSCGDCLQHPQRDDTPLRIIENNEIVGYIVQRALRKRINISFVNEVEEVNVIFMIKNLYFQIMCTFVDQIPEQNNHESAVYHRTHYRYFGCHLRRNFKSCGDAVSYGP